MLLAVDVGGTKTLAAVFNEDGQIIERHKIPTPAHFDDFIEELERLVAKFTTEDFKVATVAIPGKVDRKHGVGLSFGNLEWTNVPIQAELERIAHCPVIVENDANLAALSEARALEPSVSKVLYVTISTGIGGGFVRKGRIDPNFADIEIGHMLLEHRGRLLRWEEFASGKAIMEQFGKRARDIDDPQIWYKISRNIAVGIINLVATLTPEIIIIGGGVGSHFIKFKDRLEEQLKLYENPMVSIPPIVQAHHAEEAVIYGCYELGKDFRAKRSR